MDPVPDKTDDPRSEQAPARPAAQSGPEHVLIRRAQAGDERAFEELLRSYEGRAWRVVRNMVPCDEDARDLVQDGFLRVFRSLERFDFQYAFSTWLYRILTNLAIDHLRRRRPVKSTSAPDEEDADLELVDHDAPAPAAAMESEETVAEVRAVLATLAPHFHSVLVLRELEGLPCDEIAEIVGATHVTVRWRLHRGRKLFQEAWERRGSRAANSSHPEPVEPPVEPPEGRPQA